ncbi:MAG: hypothetical protein ACREFS_05935 [Acetobacteraceae bacterium]
MSDTQDRIVGVHLGTGGSPLILGLPVFGVASVALGMGLIGKPTGFGVIVPILLVTTGLYQLVTTGWAIILGQNIVAAIFGLFSGFWLSFGLLLLGLHLGWYEIPKGALPASLELFFISYTILFAFLIIPCLWLPWIYPLTVLLVAVALALAAAGIYAVAGYFVLAFAFLAFWEFINVSVTAMGAKGFPPLGKPLIS